MNDIPISTPSYPMLGLIVRHGAWASIALAVAVLTVALVLAYATGSAIAAIAGVVAGALTFALARTLVELVCLITDMLLPK
jgi:hypothetical protein